MKTIVQIITQNQSSEIEKMIEATKGFERIWVADRCIDDTVEKLKTLNENVITNSEGEGFLAGKMRDIGLDYVLSKDYEVVIMLDGDRIPFNLTKELVEEEMEDRDVSLGYCEVDERNRIYSLVHAEPFEKMFTCAVIIKTKFLKRVRKLSFMEGRCFHKGFDGLYGNEDIFLGNCLFSTGARIKISRLVVTGIVPSGDFLNVMDSYLLLMDLKKKVSMWK